MGRSRPKDGLEANPTADALGHGEPMPYRSPDRDRTTEALREDDARRVMWVRERIGWVAGEIGRLDRLIGEASTRIPSGRRAPPEVVALMAEKESRQSDLHALAWMVGPRYPVAILPGSGDTDDSTTLPARAFGRAPFLSGLLVGLGLSAHAALLAVLFSLGF